MPIKTRLEINVAKGVGEAPSQGVSVSAIAAFMKRPSVCECYNASWNAAAV